MTVNKLTLDGNLQAMRMMSHLHKPYTLNHLLSLQAGHLHNLDSQNTPGFIINTLYAMSKAFCMYIHVLDPTHTFSLISLVIKCSTGVNNLYSIKQEFKVSVICLPP